MVQNERQIMPTECNGNKDYDGEHTLNVQVIETMIGNGYIMHTDA